ncbi:uncharacterized protein DSM5745_06429 [Aspergillus mulundensis]|uniref:Uncharacterized protein n=1 Tax=Aspergillus mulundensis TaxID=1810919 RepID=A0A3D8RQS4_9EURO|nr:hypothetical protein DSM5745_06429 [Aspergillus mulundensis]RDW76437.1 hypothetical protein DSM5745_06429 [Aspergillus mulundensis]
MEAAGAIPSASGHVAVVGMAGRFPGCEDLDGLWDLLLRRKDVHQEIPPSRFDINEFYDASGKTKNSTLTRYGCFLSHPGLFDNRFFNISPREAAQMDPLQRMFLTTTYEALEMAGYNPSTSPIDPSKISTYFGQSTDDWKTINEQQGIQAHYLPATNRSFAPGRVSHHFKWGGGHYSIDTGCSSSMTAIHMACAALISGECDMAIAGGGNVCVIPEYFSGFSKGSFLSTTGGCKTYSNDADGYCRGEAVGTVVLRRLEDAVAAKDHILGVIAATARNSNAGEGSITYPGESAQKKLLEELLRKGKTAPEEIGFVEMHGTGTQAGDGVEMNTVRSVIAKQSRDQPLYVGALKASIGHGEAAAGISSLIKALLMLRHDAMPGQPGNLSRFKDPAAAGIQIGGAEGLSIPRSAVDGRRKVIVNSFDAAGGNTSLLLVDGPTPTPAEGSHDPRTHHIIACSAKTVESLRLNKDRLRRHLEQSPETNLSSLAYTTTARRMDHVHREAYVVESIDQLITSLKKPSSPSPTRVSPSSLAFMFTGQSSQYTAMGAALYNTSLWFQKTLNKFESQCSHFSSASFLDVVRGSIDITSATAPQVQLALVALEIALAYYLQELGLKPAMVMGHSLGEYAALCVAGVLSVKDTLYLVHERAALLEKHCTAGSWGMVAVPRSVEWVKQLLQQEGLDSELEICCLNGPTLTVVGGPSDYIQQLQDLVGGKGVKATRLQLPYAFHSSQLDCILPEFEAVAENVAFRKPSIPVVSTLTRNVVKFEGTFNASYLVRQCRQQVDFVGALETARRQGLISNGSIVVEVGPHPVCTSLLSLCLPDTQVVAVPTLKRGHSDWESISKCLAAAYVHHQEVDWEKFHGDYRSCLSVVSSLPSYAFEESEFWTPYQRQRNAEGSKDDGFKGTACLQQIESFSADKRSATFVSKIQEPSLLAAIQGHLVDEVAICPASLFIDMACGAAQIVTAGKGTAVELADLQMISPLVVSSNVEQTIRVNARLEEAKASSVEIQITSTIYGNSTQHAICRVVMHEKPTASLSIWPQMQRLVQLRVSTLTAAPSNDSCYRLTRALFYKLFDSIVEYSAPFRLLETITIDGDAHDAVSEIRIHTRDAKHGSFSLDPFTMDALVHLPGFLLNCDFDKPKGDLHIAKSIGRLLVFDSLQAEAGSSPLTCYTTVTAQGEDGATFCDTYLFTKSKRLVALVSGICFQKITRQIFGVITSSSKTTTRSNHSPNHLVTTPSPVPANTTTLSDVDTKAEGVYAVFLRAVATITGVDIEQVKSAESFEALGVDSHMAISIIAETNAAAGVLLPAAFFSNCPTIADAERELEGSASRSSSPSGGIPTPPSTASSDISTEHVKEPMGRAVLLQGNPNSLKKPLFFVAESSGSVAVYLHLPPLPDGTPIYCLESPFAHCPEKNTLSIPEMARAYITTMRTVQPHGPYLIAGYSFGSIFAYETAYQLALVGERVLGLLLMDMYAPPPALPNLGAHRFLGGLPEGPMTNMSNRLVASGLFKLTDIEMTHMEAVLKAAASYEAIPMPRGFEPVQTHIVWANKGINDNEHADEHDTGVTGMKAFMGLLEDGKTWEDVSQDEMGMMLRSWFFAAREDFGTNGWESFVGCVDAITVHEVDADHISALIPPEVQGLGEAIARAVESCSRT